MLVKWNLTRHQKRYKRADVLVLSVGKSGRTWLRVLINKFLSLHFNAPFGLDDLATGYGGIPSILYDHEAWMHFSDASLFKRVIGRNIIPAGILKQKKVILLYRDPRDVVVSLYFQKTKRSGNKFEGQIGDFIKDGKYGIANIVRVMNLWRARLLDHPACLWVSYESMKVHTESQLALLLDFIGVEAVRKDEVVAAVAFADFENMQAMERDNAFDNPILSARDISDPDTYKVRKGAVGGYLKYFDKEQISFLDRATALLDDFYPYSASNGSGNSTMGNLSRGG